MHTLPIYTHIHIHIHDCTTLGQEMIYSEMTDSLLHLSSIKFIIISLISNLILMIVMLERSHQSCHFSSLCSFYCCQTYGSVMNDSHAVSDPGGILQKEDDDRNNGSCLPTW